MTPDKDLTQLSVDETVLLNVRKRQRGISTTYVITAKEINYFQDRLSRLERIERELKELVDLQANDEGLWFIARIATESYLQQALRTLHHAVEKAILSDEDGKGEG